MPKQNVCITPRSVDGARVTTSYQKDSRKSVVLSHTMPTICRVICFFFISAALISQL